MRDKSRPIPSSKQDIAPYWDQRSPGFLENGDNSFLRPASLPAGHSKTNPSTAMACLIKTIEAEIIPRLMAAYEETGSGPGGPRTVAIQDSEVNDFTDIALGAESSRCLPFIENLLDRGVSLSTIYLHLLGPSARKLGAMWTSDTCDFTQITIALWRMQQVMYDLSPSFQADSVTHAVSQKKIMLTPVPGSQHTFGILMVAEFFRRAGWSVWGEPAASRERLLQEVRGQWFDAAGISVGSESQIDGLEELINELRQASRNKSLIIMVGGPMFAHQPSLAEQVGADATAIDAESAVAEAEQRLAAKIPQRFVNQRSLRVG